jgi:putative sterol carrier protein
MPMSAFKDADEVYTYIGGVFEKATKEPSFIEATAGTGLVVRLIQTDPDATMIIDFPGQKVITGEAAEGMPASVQLRMSSDNSNKFWQGKLNFTLAMAQRKVKLEGKRSVALKLLPLTAPLFDTYRQLLKDTGREDLLIG